MKSFRSKISLFTLWVHIFHALTVARAQECTDNDEAIARLALARNMPDIASCSDVKRLCKLDRTPALKRLCCATCEQVNNPPPVESSLPPTDETVQVFLVAGQSECLGAALVENLQADNATYPELQGEIEGTWIAAFHNHNFIDNKEDRFFISPMVAGADREKFGPEISFAERVYSVTGKRTLMVKYCAGGTNVWRQWNPESPSNAWDRDQDNGTSAWLRESSPNGIDLLSKEFLFKNAVYTMRRTKEALVEGNVPFEWAGIVWVQGQSDQRHGDPIWKAFGENTARVWEGFREEIGSDVPIVDNLGSLQNQLISGKKYATQIVKGCNAINVEAGKSANDDTSAECVPGAGNPCLEAPNLHTNLEVYEYYGYDPGFEQAIGLELNETFQWFANFPIDMHSGYEGMILKGQAMANAYLREFVLPFQPDLDPDSFEILFDDIASRFPSVRCPDNVLPTDENICWIDYRDESLMIDTELCNPLGTRRESALGINADRSQGDHSFVFMYPYYLVSTLVLHWIAYWHH